MMFFNVPFFVSNQDGLNGCYYTSWIAQWIKILSEVVFLAVATLLKYDPTLLKYDLHQNPHLYDVKIV